MKTLTIQAVVSPTGDMLANLNENVPPGETRFPVLLTLVREDEPGRAFVVGQLVTSPAEAGSLKAAVALWNQIPMLAEKWLLVWEGWDPPATDLPLGKLAKALKWFGIEVKPAAAALPQADGHG